MHVRTKELPTEGAFGHVRNFLYGEKLWEISVKFVDKIDNLGVSYDDRMRVDVQAFGPTGPLKGWRGSYGGSYAMMYSKDISAVATGGKLDLEDLPEDRIVLEIHRHWKSSWVTMYLNPCHQAAMLPPKKDDLDMARMAKILKVFKSLIASHRQEPLHGLKVTKEEFALLLENNWLKCHKGKKPEILDKPIYVGKYPVIYKYFELNGATITTEGKNIVELH
jgi:hypothetical protein